MSDGSDRRTPELSPLWLAGLVNSAQDAIISADAEGRITTWNPAAERLFGYSATEAVGRPATFLKPPGLQGHSADKLARIRRGDDVPAIETVRRTKDGRDIEVSIVHSAIWGLDGALIGTSIVARDIGERKQAERELAVAHEAVVAAGREYEAFAYAVAHELRTPLRAVGGYVRLAQQEYESGRPEGARAKVEQARTGVRQMGGLIDSLLRLAQVSHQPLTRDGVDLSALAQAAIGRLRDDSPSRRVESVVEPGLHVIGDPDLLGTVLSNLLANAWKFTRTQMHPRIEFGRDGEAYFVRDNGAGFDMAHYDKLFGLFQRLHHQSDFEGTGIGLATSHHIIRRHGGRIWAKSAPGAGATFSFTLAAADRASFGRGVTPDALDLHVVVDAEIGLSAGPSAGRRPSGPPRR